MLTVISPCNSKDERQKVKRNFVFIFAATLLLSACGTEKDIEVHSPWMRPAAQGENEAVYFVIHNHSSNANELVGISSEIAEAVEIHESTMTHGDVMQMDMLSSVPLGANGDVEFAPGGLHVMLVGLKQDIEVGDKIELVLHFKNYEDIKLKVPAKETDGPGEGHPTSDH